MTGLLPSFLEKCLNWLSERGCLFFKDKKITFNVTRETSSEIVLSMLSQFINGIKKLTITDVKIYVTRKLEYWLFYSSCFFREKILSYFFNFTGKLFSSSSNERSYPTNLWGRQFSIKQNRSLGATKSRQPEGSDHRKLLAV